MSGLSRRQMEITNALGLHLRAASQFVQLSRQFHAEVRVFCNGRAADGRSILDLMMLAAECGASLELEVNGPEAEEATAALGHRGPVPRGREAGTSVPVPDSLDGAFQPPHRRHGEERSGGRPRLSSGYVSCLSLTTSLIPRASCWPVPTRSGTWMDLSPTCRRAVTRSTRSATNPAPSAPSAGDGRDPQV